MGLDPFTIISIASTAMSALGAMRQADAQAASYQAQAQAQEYNATVAENNARATMDQANAKEEQQRRRFRMMQGGAIAAAAQSGAGLGQSDSNSQVLEQNALMNELDALTIRYEGQTQAQGLQAQAEIDRYGAKVSRLNAGQAKTAGYINAGASILSGASNYMRASGYGMPDSKPSVRIA